MSIFNKLLNEALLRWQNDNTSGVSLDEYIKFATALISSTSVNKIPEAIERAMSLSTSELTSIIKQVQFTGDTQALKDALTNKPEYATQFLELGRKVLPELGDSSISQLQAEMEKWKPKPSEGVPIITNRKLEEEGRVLCPSCKNQGLKETSYRSLNCPSCGLDWWFCDYCSLWSNTDPFDTTLPAGNGSGKCVDCEKETYNAEGDYYNQGDDGDGH